ncbi:hypothetical protein MHI24_17510 [Paenibacillus sp. FSL K6-1096]
MDKEQELNLTAPAEEEFEVEGYYSCSSAAAMCYHDCIFSTVIFTEAD